MKFKLGRMAQSGSEVGAAKHAAIDPGTDTSMEEVCDVIPLLKDTSDVEELSQVGVEFDGVWLEEENDCEVGFCVGHVQVGAIQNSPEHLL